MKPKTLWALVLAVSIIPGRAFSQDSEEALQALRADLAQNLIHAARAVALAKGDLFKKTTRLQWSVEEAEKLFAGLGTRAEAVPGPRGQAGFQAGTRTTGVFLGRWKLVGVASNGAGGALSGLKVYIPSGITLGFDLRFLSFSEASHPFVAGGVVQVARSSNLEAHDSLSGWRRIEVKDQGSTWAFSSESLTGSESRESHAFECRLAEPGQMLCRYQFHSVILECPPAGTLACAEGYLAFSREGEAEKVERTDLGWKVEDARALVEAAKTGLPGGAMGFEGAWRLAATAKLDSPGSYVPGGQADKTLSIRSQRNPFSSEGGGLYSEQRGFLGSWELNVRCGKDCGSLLVNVLEDGRHERELRLYRLDQDHALGVIDRGRDVVTGMQAETFYGFVRVP